MQLRSNWWAAVLGCTALVAGCGVAPTQSAPPSVPSVEPAVVDSGSPSAQTQGAFGICAPIGTRLSVTGWGAAGGTTYAVVHVVLRGPQPCLMPTGPAVEILDAGGSKVVAGPSVGTDTAVLRAALDLRLGWASWCGSQPSAPLTLRLTLPTGDLTTALPVGFGASCQGVATKLSIEPVAP